MASVTNDTLDAPLLDLVNNVTRIYLTSQEVVSFAEASSTYCIGVKTGYTLGSPENATPSGRKIVCPAVADGTTQYFGTATHYALCTNSALKATGALSSSKIFTTLDPWTLTSFEIKSPVPVNA